MTDTKLTAAQAKELSNKNKNYCVVYINSIVEDALKKIEKSLIKAAQNRAYFLNYPLYITFDEKEKQFKLMYGDIRVFNIDQDILIRIVQLIIIRLKDEGYIIEKQSLNLTEHRCFDEGTITIRW